MLMLRGARRLGPSHSAPGSIREVLRHRSASVARCVSSAQDSATTERNWRTKVVPALETFRQAFGHCIVDEEFEVPASAPWPTAVWGMPLGAIVRDIRAGNAYVGQAAHYEKQLQVLRFPWDHQAAVWSDRILPALEAYAAECGNGRVPFMFVVPSRDPWPRSAWGMNLGTTVASMRGMGSYFAYVGRDVDRLNELCYSLEMSTRVWRKCVCPLLEIHAERFGNDAPVRADFVIPSEAPWPEEMWGVRLGAIVARNTRHLSSV
ncbi:hypothetical protein PHYPSEUDO_005390 [Phytophthora pseudosyringae]|uniref:Helicase-associated domain-containing protein n=1 Tax=Phytophthora pseudosyringae TaxID=221518 RepID=A0A8T1VM22_9STRA|nr:hypothetical protein PHYPSEUDO_005390 [Phytophthora pseudosyringae]